MAFYFALFLIVVISSICVLHFLALGRFEREVNQALNDICVVKPSDEEMVHNDGGQNIIQLPPIVKQFAGKAGVPESGQAHHVSLCQDAEMRMGPDKPWRRITARQNIAVGQPAFVWDARQYFGPFTLIRIMDAFLNGAGMLKARLLGSILVADLSHGEADRDQLMRYLAELAWAPDALLVNKSLTWRMIDDHTVEVRSDCQGAPTIVRLYFDAAGDIFEIQADARGDAGKDTVARPWVGRFRDYQESGGRRIPTYGEVGYIYEDGYAAYWRGRITDYQVF